MQSSLHQGPCASMGMKSIFVNVDNFLELRVVEEESVIRSIAAADETLLEVLDVESPDSGGTFINSTMEDDSGFFFRREQCVYLLVQTYGQLTRWKEEDTLVDIISIHELKFADLIDILQLGDSPFQGSNFFEDFFHTGIRHLYKNN